jgi:TonB family protein
MPKVCLVLYATSALVAAVSQTPAAEDVYRVGQGITAPKVLRKVEPTYTYEARSARVQGSVLFEAVVDTSGKLTEITMVSPLGYGLDERAQEAVEQWKLKPGEKDGKPVKVRANIEVKFRLSNSWYDVDQERRRTRFNIAVMNLKERDKGSIEHASEAIQELSREKYAPAAYVHALLLREHKVLPAQPDEFVKLLLFASEKHFGPAMYEVGNLQLQGRVLPLDREAGLQLIHDAAVLGSTGAQFFLGMSYEAGHEMPKDVLKARRYFRLCAAAGQAHCQLRLARLLLDTPGRTEREYVQALAWLYVAADGGMPDAQTLLQRERVMATAEQIAWVAGLKPQLVRGH